MKKLLLLVGVFAALSLITSCDPSENDRDNLEVTAENLQGTWEAFVEHDFAQGYQQKYRIKFDGQNFTMWHMHQEPKKEGDEWGPLTEVGDKYSGKWEYNEGKLTFSHEQWWYSSWISSMNPLRYTYNPYNVETMEADPWGEASSGIVEMLEKDEWGVISLTKNALTVKINMDTFKLEKK